MPSLRPTASNLGPWQKITPTNAAGEANSDATPQIVSPTAARAIAEALRADTQIHILVELRVISRLLAIGLNVTDEVEAVRENEIAALAL